MKVLSVILTIALSVGVILFGYSMIVSHNLNMEKINAIILTLTLIFLIWYAQFTREIAITSQKQFSLIEGPNLLINFGRIYHIPNINREIEDIKSNIHVMVSKSYNLEAQISIIFRYGDLIIKHSDQKFYSGRSVWYLGGESILNGNFSLSDVIKATKLSFNDFENAIFTNTLDKKVEVAVFSRFKRFDSDEKYINNMARFYYIEKSVLRNELVMVWIPEPIIPPVEMEALAFENNC
ncbi:MAG: hypothetical protein JW763_03115 [candidate division Zixibacteria bacterium]|nr:hypothetical protein [candidate division Zixibacteria bacterium]